MAQEHSRELWARETRSRALSTVMIANIALFTFFMLFRNVLSPRELFDPIYIVGLAVQTWRTFFQLRFKHLTDQKWLKWNDRGILVFGIFWLFFATAVAASTKPSDMNVNAFMVVLLIGYLSSSSQFFAYDKKIFFVFIACVTPPGVWIASKFSDVTYQRFLIAILPIIYAAVQIKTRRALWEAMFRVSRSQASMKGALDSLPLGVSVLRDGKYEMANAYSSRLIGAGENALVGKAIGFSGHDSEFVHQYTQFIKSTETVDTYEQSVKTKDGFREHFILFRKAAHDPSEVIVVSMDIEELSVAQRELELERTRSEVTAKTMAGLAHELNGPLIALTEQVLVKQTPDIDLARDHIRRMQVVVNRIKAG